MELQLCVVAETDLDGRRMHLVVSGILTTANQQLLASVITGCRALSTGASLLVDLRAAQHPEAAAMDLLAWELEHDPPASPPCPVSLILPGPMAQPPGCGAAATIPIIWVGTRWGDR